MKKLMLGLLMLIAANVARADADINYNFGATSWTSYDGEDHGSVGYVGSRDGDGFPRKWAFSSDISDGICLCAIWAGYDERNKSYYVAGVDPLPTGVCVVPSVLNGMQVTEISGSFFAHCAGLTKVVIPDGVKTVQLSAFWDCRQLETVYLPATAIYVGTTDAFKDCPNIQRIEVSPGNPCFTSIDGVLYWKNNNGMTLQYRPTAWSPSQHNPNSVSVTVTNVVVQYVTNSIEPAFANPPTADTGFVNIITEVKGGAVAVPSSWADNYPSFTTKFGADFTKALTMKTGKKDGAGNDMLVWQDYVAGTDPTKEDDVFKASITIVDGKVTISWTPELDDERKDMRKYTTWGKKSLMDKDWEVVPVGNESEYNFFKVTVEMK